MQLRSRLEEREFPAAEISAAIDRLLETGVLDDRRVAHSYATTAAKVKGRGRLRVIRELQAIGIDRQTAAEAVGEVFGDLDERSLIAKAIQKKLRGRQPPKDTAARARLYQYLIRQGFSPALIADALRKR